MKLKVYITLESGKLLQAGWLDAEKNSSEFLYTPEWLDSHHAFPIDPIHLPLQKALHSDNHSSGLFGVLEDALPDDWGRKLLCRQLGTARPTPPELLCALGSRGIGALSFSEEKQPLPFRDSPALQLKDLMKAAIQFEEGNTEDSPLLSQLLRAGSSPGGARPKASFEDARGLRWIAKFPSHKDRYDVSKWEAVSLETAKSAGITVPEFRLENIAGRSALLVRRFDISPQEGRRHMMSFQSLLDARGWYNLRYDDLRRVLARWSPKPRKDLTELYCRMTLNALLGNTDDHLKNFSAFVSYSQVLDSRGSSEGQFCLTPAYDLLPDLENRREHVLAFEHDLGPPDRKILRRIARSWGLSHADDHIDQLVSSFELLHTRCEKVGIPEKEFGQIHKDILRRIEKANHI